VGEQIAAHAAPTSFREGILRVRVDSPIWASELNYLTSDIREKANGLLGAQAIAEVRVWTGTGTFTPLKPRGQSSEPKAAKRPRRLVRRGGQAFGDPGASDGGRSAFERAFAAWQNKRSKGGS
jgi:hypothetical protein